MGAPVRKVALTVFVLCAIGWMAWLLASSEGRVDADERVSTMLPPPERQGVWEPGEAFQAIAFGGQAMLGAALLWMGCRRAGRRG